MVDDGHRASAVIAGIRARFRKDVGERSPVGVNDLINKFSRLFAVNSRVTRYRCNVNCATASHT